MCTAGLAGLGGPAFSIYRGGGSGTGPRIKGGPAPISSTGTTITGSGMGSGTASGSATAKTCAVARGAATVAINISRRSSRAATGGHGGTAREAATSATGTGIGRGDDEETDPTRVYLGGARRLGVGDVGATEASTRTRTTKDAGIFTSGRTLGARYAQGSRGATARP